MPSRGGQVRKSSSRVDTGEKEYLEALCRRAIQNKGMPAYPTMGLARTLVGLGSNHSTGQPLPNLPSKVYLITLGINDCSKTGVNKKAKTQKRGLFQNNDFLFLKYFF